MYRGYQKMGQKRERFLQICIIYEKLSSYSTKEGGENTGF